MVATGKVSRSQAQRAVRGGRVRVDGQLQRDPATKILPDQSVTLDGERLAVAVPRYLALHKPAGYLSATRDDTHPTVLDLLPLEQRDGLHIAGRLDLDTTGLVLLTDDGDWSHRITSPRHGWDKVYRVTLAEPVAGTALDGLAAGILLKGEHRPTRPAGVERLDARQVRLTLHEGRYHQVKRMFGALGNRVVALHREQVGPVSLYAPSLAEGEFRSLNPAEIAALG